MSSTKNKTIKLTDKELLKFEKRLINCEAKKEFIDLEEVKNKTINGNTIEILKKFPSQSIDLIIVDPPYNISKIYNNSKFSSMKEEEYEKWLESWIPETFRILKEEGSIYVCTDWKSSIPILKVLRKYFFINNRITWAREKGRGSKSNWKNNIEDIYFASKSKNYYFNSNAVKIKKKVLAPYKNKKGMPKDWFVEGKDKFRLTHHSNIWDDLTVPYWSMKENTDHPTQKPEKLIAKLVLASSKEGDIILDPFLGSGTTSVVSKKLGRNYIGIELDKVYASIAEKRLDDADNDKTIQGYNGKFFLGKGVK